MRAASALIALTLSFAASGCRDGGDSKTPLSAVVPNGSATTPTFARAPQTATPQAPPADEPAEPEVDELAGDEDAGGDEADAPAEPEEKEAPLPDVEVKNVGMHIGGEKNTAAQKRPIRAEVAKHYDAMKRCYAKASDPPKTATFGVDMRIEGEGGNPKISNPRSGLKGDGVKECLVGVFEGITFPRQPKGVARMVSYSIEFRR